MTLLGRSGQQLKHVGPTAGRASRLASYPAARTAGRPQLAALREEVRWLRPSTAAGVLLDFADAPA